MYLCGMANTVPLLLALESSCDDTGAAVLRGLEVLSNRVAGQLAHAEFGGVVPELASRATKPRWFLLSRPPWTRQGFS